MSSISVNEIFDKAGTGAPAFPNGMSATGAALTDPEITGGIYLGGTGSANYLEDYEEGTWTPSDGSGAGLSFTNTSGNCFYTRVGNMVYATFRVSFPSTSSSSLARLAGLPFSIRSTTDGIFSCSISEHSSAENLTMVHSGVNNFIFLTCNGSVSLRSNSNMSGEDVRGTLIYETDA